MEIPPPDPAKLLQSWMEWERGEVTPGRVMANLKTGGLRQLLENLAAAQATGDAGEARAAAAGVAGEARAAATGVAGEAAHSGAGDQPRDEPLGAQPPMWEPVV